MLVVDLFGEVELSNLAKVKKDYDEPLEITADVA